MAIHLLYNHRYYLDSNYNETKELNETNIYNYPKMTIRAMVLSALAPMVVPWSAVLQVLHYNDETIKMLSTAINSVNSSKHDMQEESGSCIFPV